MKPTLILTRLSFAALFLSEAPLADPPAEPQVVPAQPGVNTTLPVEANEVKEISLVSPKPCANPFMEVELDAVVTRPAGKQLRVPAFRGRCVSSANPGERSMTAPALL